MFHPSVSDGLDNGPSRKIKYEQILDGDWVEPSPQTGHKMACCDCGLVHTINFRIVKGKVQFQAFREKKRYNPKSKK